ncbi:MAG TPA: hypothetical protein VJB96_01760 [Patescibacteria group bacterium]|nr:hypothetical protein [Patescibacteria group bacterium]
MKKLPVAWTLIIIAITVILRLYKIESPVADWHSFRQADTASVARIFVDRGIDLLRPRYHDLSNIQSGKDNPEGWRMVEFPLYQGIAAFVTRLFPIVSIELSLRIVTIAAAAGTAWLLMQMAGPLAGFVYAVLPYSVFFGRTVLPETFAVFWAMLSLFLLSRGDKPDFAKASAGKGNWGELMLASTAGAIALLVKPTAGFLLLPIPYLVYRRHGFSFHSLVRIVAYSFICLLPLWWWRGWITQFPEGIAVYDWLFNKGNIRFKGAWFQWLFAERVGKLILGYWGLIPFGLGILTPNTKKEGWLFYFLGLGGLLYLIVFAAGNVQHDYYQIILLPIVSIYVANGLVFLVTHRGFSPVARTLLTVTCALFMLAFSWYTIRTFYWINRPEIIEAGMAADAILPKDAKVIAPYNGDTTFLYQTKRIGWPLGFDIDQKLAMGATHYVTVSPTDNDWETKTLAEQYTVVIRNEKFAIIDLTKPR